MGIKRHFPSAFSSSLLVLVIFLEIFTVRAGDITTFEVNIFKFKEEPEPIVGISVPGHIFMGNVTEGGWSKEMDIRINNTGDVPVTVIPMLIDNNEKVFRYLYFREYKTHNNTPVAFDRIGEFRINITTTKSFYVMLNLSDYPEEIPQDIIGHRADVKFVAFAR